MMWKIPVAKPSVGEAETHAVARVVSEGWLTRGSQVAEFERRLAVTVSSVHGVAVNYGTSALILALRALESELSTLARLVALLLTDRKKTVAIAESCTGGLIAKSLTDIPGSSRYFLRGYVTYSDQAKMELLGVSEQMPQGSLGSNAELPHAVR